ncbi:hypothetical protein KUTeg_019212 [Tegillarca granosa]|uniref:Uncharacterized protein n=1 Tax=Tegillarca granosa TaxID=220873 RepID=A0ABQ9EG46_TEGGR|nr:hypothetical protein KUTeg_019212 [Tegillarca granosa]
MTLRCIHVDVKEFIGRMLLTLFQKTRWENNDLITVFKEYVKSINPQNLSLLIESYIKRTDLGISRELDPLKKSEVKQIKCRTLILVGDDAPHVEDAIYMNSRMDPSETDFFKIQDCGGMPLEETPGKVCEAFRLFLQGMGYVYIASHVVSFNFPYFQASCWLMPSLRQVHKPTMKTDLHSTRHQPDFSTTTPIQSRYECKCIYTCISPHAACAERVTFTHMPLLTYCDNAMLGFLLYVIVITITVSVVIRYTAVNLHFELEPVVIKYSSSYIYNFEFLLREIRFWLYPLSR